jgi:hypothetical protein
MEQLPWHAMVEIVRPHVVRILTPRGSGTGFLLFNSKAAGFVAVATAAHVINSSHFWEEPIRIQHFATGATTLTRAGDRAVLIDNYKDVAAIMFYPGSMQFPENPLPLSSKDTHVKVGVEIGWLGFPAVATELCFFSGRVSAYDELRQRYLVDGVAINGVSGGPSFKAEDTGVSIMGAVSAYIPNTATSTGQVLPGLSVVADVVEFHNMIGDFKSFADAQAQQTPPSEVPAAPLQEPEARATEPPKQTE